MSQGDFQTRNEEGELCWFDTLDEALQKSRDDKTVWKISFPVGKERVRLVRDPGGMWVLDLIDSVLANDGSRTNDEVPTQ